MMGIRGRTGALGGVKTGAALGSAAFFVLAPGVMAGVVPWALTGWHAGSAPGIVRVAGAAITVAGALVVVAEFARFVREGRGTPAPVAPTERLVVGGLYRYVRNPMYLGVATTIVGQAILLARPVLAVYAAVFVAVVATFVRVYEEPTLAEQFGADYEAYRRAVPAWRPRLRPWAGPS
jgi:protein-S-isoprenylcysteine O-methyltransferase Ste14